MYVDNIYIRAQDILCNKVQIRLKLIYLDFIFVLHYGQPITQVCFSSISMDRDYHNAELAYAYGRANIALIFTVIFPHLCSLPCCFILWWRHQHCLKLSLTV